MLFNMDNIVCIKENDKGCVVTDTNGTSWLIGEDMDIVISLFNIDECVEWERMPWVEPWE